MRKAVDIEFAVHGDDLQFVEIMLDPSESIIAEAGAMMYMDDAIMMDAIFGDGSGRDEGKGLMGKMLGAGKRVVTGESLFMTEFTNRGYEKKAVAFAGTYPGKIIPLDLGDYGEEIICQRDSFLCAAKGIAIEIAFQKNIGAGLFGGEGFIMQRLVGDGLTFLHAGGTIIQKDLKAGEVFKLDTGCLVAMTKTINYDVEMVGNIKSAIFGGEGLFLATLKGPGTVWMQSLPFSRLARKIFSVGAKGKSSGKGEGSLLGGIGIGDLFGND
ncbi:MAG: TIGR00266 family protein [Tissierellia bacterium]|nr:TIGR00266 family protein [Tissierellia bacterium]